jgi:uncharacterized membrane protein
MFCHKCGAEFSGQAQFCTACGAQLVLAAQGLEVRPAARWKPLVTVQVRGGHWVGEGWRLVKADMGIYALLALLVMISNSAVPFVLHGPLTAGLHIYIIKRLAGRRAEFADLFKGFNFFIPALVVSLLIGLFVFAGFVAFIIPGLVLAAMYLFTYLFIVDKRMDFWPAMQASHAVVKHDYVGFTLFLILLGLVNLLGLLCRVVGLLVSVPVTYAAITVAYQEIVGFEPHTIEAL